MNNDHLRLIRSEWGDWDAICERFTWDIPQYFNMGYSICERHAATAGSEVALYFENERGESSELTYAQLDRLTNRFGNALKHCGISKGDRVAIILPQRQETAIAHIAIYKLGAVALPLSVLFGPEAVGYRLLDSGTKVVLADSQHCEMLESIRDELPDLTAIIDCDHEQGFWSMIECASDQLETVATLSNDPAFLIYTSGTTGPPKGALGAHRCLIGNLTGFEMSHNFFPQQDDLFWTPADWAWTGGLLDGLIPSMYYGVPVLGYDGGKFDPEKACHLLEKYRVRNAFLPPTALKMLRQLDSINSRNDINIRSIMSAGESLGVPLFHWGIEAFGIEINEMWAQTEFNYIAGNCAEAMPVRPGSVGKAYPGHRVEVVDESGSPMPAGDAGELAADRDDPVMVLGYWNNDEATKSKFIDRYWGTGDTGYKDEDGYIWFVGRTDDVISSAGYRIGPGEIEDCLMKHPSIAQAAVVGVPDELRGEEIKAFVVLKEGFCGDDALTKDIQQSVRTQLAAYEYPRQIEYIDKMPMTTTGKVRRNDLRTRSTSGSG